jgi:hypothetical protein
LGRVVRDVDAAERTDAFHLLAEVVQAGSAALAGDEVRLELTPPRHLEFAVEVTAEGEQAALHRAISR